MNNYEIAVRGYIDSEDNSQKSSNTIHIPNFARVLVFDTETTVDQYQNLKFGSCQIYDSRKLVDKKIFYEPNTLTKKEIEILKEFDSDIIPVRKFIDRIFLPEIFDRQTLCIGFNLPFDISRLAIDFGHGRGTNKGYFSFLLSENKHYPRILVKSIDSTKSFIRFGTSKFSIYQHTGNFLDLRTLSYSLSNEKHTLESACKFFKSKIQKLKEKHKKIIALNYIKYNIRDVEATYHLYLKLIDEYKKYNTSKPVTKIFSPASIGKSLLDDIGIMSFSTVSEISKQTLGYLMSTFYGARTEVKRRKTPIKIAYLDFLSMYPTVFILQNLWSFVVAEKIVEEDFTKEIRDFVRKIMPEDLREKETWKNLSVIVQITPDSDILPVRARYGNKFAYNIGINYLTCERPMWFTLSDIIASKILSGRIPTITKAIRFVPVGKQKLKPIKILDEEINPKDDIFKRIIEKRQELKESNDPNQQILKIIANATSYGIYAQINSEDRESKARVFSIDEFQCTVRKTETQGERFNPIIATLITSASRLILALVEYTLERHGEPYAFCDTDSMAIPEYMTQTVQEFFQPLNPYNFDKSLFKMEPENFVDGKRHDLWFYGISAKRYVLYNFCDDGKIIIRKHSSHGLGHITNPFNKKKDWEKEFWTDILGFHYGTISSEQINEKYSNYYAISKLRVSTPLMLSRFKKINQGKNIYEKIKPFNFFHVGFGNDDDVKPVSSFKNEPSEAVFDDFIDYSTGNVCSGEEYWKDLMQIFWDYVSHPESKFDGKNGILQRKRVNATNITVIGKESNNLEDLQILGLDDESYTNYVNSKIDVKKILEMTLQQARVIGINKNQLYRMQNAIKKGRFKPQRRTLVKLRLI